MRSSLLIDFPSTIPQATAIFTTLGAMWLLRRHYRLDPAVVRVAALAHVNSSTEALLVRWAWRYGYGSFSIVMHLMTHFVP